MIHILYIKNNNRCLAKIKGTMKKILPSLFVLIFLVIANSAFAQSITVSGTVFDENESPLPGVSILIKNSTTGTVTDLDGRYKISVPSSNSVLV